METSASKIFDYCKTHLDIQGVDLGITTDEIIECIHEGRSTRNIPVPRDTSGM